MGWFKKSTPPASVEQALVSYVTNEGYGTNVLKSSTLYTAMATIAADVASCSIRADTPILARSLSDRNLLFSIVYQMLYYGNAYVAIGGNGKFQLINQNHVSLAYDDETNAVKYYVDGKEVSSSRILHFFDFTENGAYGISRLKALGDTLKAERSLNSLLSNYLNAGIRGTTVIKLPEAQLSDDAIKNLREQFSHATSGDNSMTAIVVDESMQVQNLPLNTDVLNVIDKVNDLVIRRVAAVFGLPVEKLGLENAHSNAKQSAQTSYLKGTLQHIFDCITRELTDKLGAHGFSFDTSALISVDPVELQEQAVNAYTSGLMTLNEARELMNLPRLDSNGDKFKGDDNQ